jgi:uncharacterized protein involved in exopolysaccharide biosynthesis
LQAIQNASLQLQSLNDSTHRAQERRLLIERQIADSQAVPVTVLVPTVGATEPPVPTNPAERLELLRARLAGYLQRYTPDHPEVVSLKRTIDELAARVADETPLSAAQEPPAKPLTPAEAAQKKKILDLQAELAVVDHQLETNRVEEKRLKAIIADYQAKVDAAPSRESELVELTRDYGTLQSAYSSLLMKREDSAIAANLERRQIGEQFRILDPASRPERPFNQVQRFAVIASGTMAGFVLGLAFIGWRDYRNSSFRREEDVHQTLRLPVFALIPLIQSEPERRAVRRRILAVDIAGSLGLMAAAAVVVVWRLKF